MDFVYVQKFSGTNNSRVKSGLYGDLGTVHNTIYSYCETCSVLHRTKAK